MALLCITPPTAEPVTLRELFDQCGYDPALLADPQQELQISTRLRRYLKMAREDCENRTRTAFLTQTWRWTLDGWPRTGGRYNGERYNALLLPRSPLQAVTTFTYIDVGGLTQPMSDWGFQLDPGAPTQPARLTAPYLLPWPPTRLVPNNITVEFRCGYGDSPDAVPGPVRQAVLVLAEAYDDPTKYKDIDGLVNGLLSKHTNRAS